MDADIVDAKIEEAFKQKRPPSSRTELARQHFAETLQDLQDRLCKLEGTFRVFTYCGQWGGICVLSS